MARKATILLNGVRANDVAVLKEVAQQRPGLDVLESGRGTIAM